MKIGTNVFENTTLHKITTNPYKSLYSKYDGIITTIYCFNDLKYKSYAFEIYHPEINETILYGKFKHCINVRLYDIIKKNQYLGI